jgi:hypothetical protein
VLPTKNGCFQPPPAFRRSEADRPLCRPDHNATHHQTADTARAARFSGVSAHVHQWSFERRPWHVGLITRASVSAPWLAEAGTSATDQPHCGYPSSTLTPGLRSLMAQNSPNCWLPTTWKPLASRHTFAYDGSEWPLCVESHCHDATAIHGQMARSKGAQYRTHGRLPHSHEDSCRNVR